MRFTKFVNSLVFIIIMMTVSYAEEKTVTVATLDDYSPYCFPVNTKSTKFKDVVIPGTNSSILQGYSWDILKESFHEMGYTIKLTVCPWARAMNYVKNGTVDILFPTGKNSEREKIYYYSREPVNIVNFLIYTKKDSLLEWDGINSLNGLTIGVMRGWNYGEEFKANTFINKESINKITQGFKMLDGNRLDGFAGYEVVFDYDLKKTNFNYSFTKHPTFDSTHEYVVGLKTNERVIQIIVDFDTGKKRISKNGIFDKIVKRWQ